MIMKKYYYKFILFETNKIFWVFLNEDGKIRYGDSVEYDLGANRIQEQIEVVENLDLVYLESSLEIISIYSLKKYLPNI